MFGHFLHAELFSCFYYLNMQFLLCVASCVHAEISAVKHKVKVGMKQKL